MMDACFNSKYQLYQSALFVPLINLLIEMLSPCAIQQKPLIREGKQMRSLFQQLKINETILKERVKTLKNYDTWRKTKLMRINTEEMKKIENESLLSVAFNCGFKNQKNQVLQDIFKMSSKNITTAHSEEKSAPKSFSSNQKKLSFVEYKNTKQQLFKINSNITPQPTGQKPISKSSVFIEKTSLDKTPREIAHLRKTMKTLPVKPLNKIFQNPQLNKHLTTTKQTSYSRQKSRKNNTYRDVWQRHNTAENTQPINKKKQFFKQKVDQIMSSADTLLGKERQLRPKEKNSQRRISPQVRLNKTVYWPEYTKYSMSSQDKSKITQIRSNYRQAFQQDFAFQDYILQIVRNMRQDFTQIEEQQKAEMIEAIKNAFELRFKYKIDVERGNYRRNVKSYLKCILDYRNERKREEVKANGIRRFKRQSLMQKIKMLVPQKNEDFQI